MPWPDDDLDEETLCIHNHLQEDCGEECELCDQYCCDCECSMEDLRAAQRSEDDEDEELDDEDDS